MVVDRSKLFRNDAFNGFVRHGEKDYEKRILENFYYIKRGLAEKDPSKKQPIGYAIIVNKKEKNMFVYQRSPSNKAHGDERLQNKWSCGVGGHIEIVDEKSENPIVESMLREINEEVGFLGDAEAKVLGYINDESNDVGRVHFGILYLIETDKDVTPKSEELKTGKMMRINDVESIFSSNDFDVEEWSRIALEAVKQEMD